MQTSSTKYHEAIAGDTINCEENKTGMDEETQSLNYNIE